MEESNKSIRRSIRDASVAATATINKSTSKRPRKNNNNNVFDSSLITPLSNRAHVSTGTPRSARLSTVSTSEPPVKKRKYVKAAQKNATVEVRKSPRVQTVKDAERSLQRANTPKKVRGKENATAGTQKQKRRSMKPTSVYGFRERKKPQSSKSPEVPKTKKQPRASKFTKAKGRGRPKKIVQEEAEYVVEEILQHKIACEINFDAYGQEWNEGLNELAFLVKWQGWLEQTWEPLEHLIQNSKFENYLNQYLVPTIGREEGKDVSFKFVEPVLDECYYLKHLYKAESNTENTVIEPPPAKRKIAAIRSPKIVAKPKPKKSRPKKNPEAEVANRALQRVLNDESFVLDQSITDNAGAASANVIPNVEQDFFGGAPALDDFIYEADVILGTYDTPQIPTTRKPTRPKKNAAATKKKAPLISKKKPQRISAQETPRVKTRSMNACPSTSTSICPPTTFNPSLPSSSSTVPQPSSTEYYDMNYVPMQEPVNNEAHSAGDNQLTYDCLDGTELVVGHLYVNENGTYLTYDGQYLYEVDPSQIIFANDNEMVNGDSQATSSNLPPSSSNGSSNERPLRHSNTVSVEEMNYQNNQQGLYFVNEEQDDPMLMPPNQAFSFNNSFVSPYPSHHQISKENEAPQQPQQQEKEGEGDRSFLVENGEHNLSINFNFDNSGNPLLLPSTPNLTPAPANESTISNPFHLFGLENGFELSGNILENFMDEL